ncbi:MAG: prolyl oligopeptidase family serine peptidase, partial [Cyanobacteria bacterium J06600_6]
GLAESRELLINWLNSLEEATGVPLERTIMAGFSQGGAMTLDVGLTLPLAALCSFSGYLHYEPQTQSERSYPPTLIIHGTEDPVVPLQAAEKARSELTQIGVGVEYQTFNMAHEVKDEAIALFKEFITKEVINSASD